MTLFDIAIAVRKLENFSLLKALDSIPKSKDEDDLMKNLANYVKGLGGEIVSFNDSDGRIARDSKRQKREAKKK